MADPDVFISYARDDAATARKFADGLEAAGLTVWWDDALRSGQVFDEAIEQALRAAKVVVVLWSPASVQSRWVRAEATLADRNGTLVPAMIAPCERPILFEMVQTADLAGWEGDAADPAWRAFADQLRERVGGGTPDPSALPRVQRRALPDKPSIAVLPFVNLSGDPEQDYFADGVVDDIITALTRFNQLFVIARSSSFTYKSRQVDNRTVADELGVRFVLEGSVRKAGNRLRITGNLVDAQSGEHLWADRYDGALEDVFDLQDRITEAVVGVIEPSIQMFQMRRSREKPTENLDAYDLYLRALPHLWSFAPDRLPPAKTLLAHALELDPDYPQALASMAWAFEQSRWYGPEYQDISLQEAGQEAARLARAALATGTEDAHMIALCGFIILFTDRDRQTAIAAKERALRRNPNASWANHYCSLIEIYTGNYAAGLELAEKALRQNPIDTSRSHFMLALGEALCGLGRYEETIAAFERYIGDMPSFLPGLLLGARAYAYLGEMNRSHELVQRVLQINPDYSISRHLERMPAFSPEMERAWCQGLRLAGFPE